jgi:putative addiction module component (TIGR02574 family)
MNSLLSEQVLSLSISEKLQLIEDIWDSIVVDTEQIPLTQSHQQELDRRLGSYQNLENEGDSWELVNLHYS